MNLEKKKNIVFPIEFNHCTGGMIFSVIALIKHLATDYNIYILAHKDAEILQLGLPAKHLILKKEWNISMITPVKTIRTFLEVKKLLQQFDKEQTLVFTNNVGSELIFSGFGFFSLPFKRVFVSRGGDYLGKTGWIIKKGFKSVDHFIAISKRQHDVLVRTGIQESKITLIHNGIAMNVAEDYKYEFHKRKNVVIAVVGYINPGKNQILAVNALADLLHKGDFVLDIYGAAISPEDISYKNRLLETANSLKIQDKIVLKGFVKDLNQIYMESDILVSCSLSEGFGRTIAEAMSYGIPCVGLKESGGIVDIITDEHDGILITNNKEQLVTAISRICEDEGFRNKISSNAIDTYRHKFTESVMNEKYTTFLKDFY